MWRNFSGSECLQGWNLLDFINFLVLMLFSLTFAGTLVIFALTVVCFGPCLYSQFKAYLRERANNEENREEQITNVIKGLVHKKFDRRNLTHMIML